MSFLGWLIVNKIFLRKQYYHVRVKVLWFDQETPELFETELNVLLRSGYHINATYERENGIIYKLGKWTKKYSDQQLEELSEKKLDELNLILHELEERKKNG